jgi:hypothetical protein
MYNILRLKLLTYSFAEFSALLPDLQTQFSEKNHSVKYSNETFKSTKSLVNHDVDTEKDTQNTAERQNPIQIPKCASKRKINGVSKKAK